MADITPPTISITSNKTALKAGDTALITFTLSEAATDFVLADITFSGGTLSNFLGSGVIYSVTFTPNQNSNTTGSVSIGNFKFSDLAGNANEDGVDANNRVSFIIDTIPPTVRISSPRTYLGINETPTITFTLSEPSTNFDISDVSITGGTLRSFQGSGTSYSAVLTPTGSDNGFISITTGRFTDVLGNNNLTSSFLLFSPYAPLNANVEWIHFLGTSEDEKSWGITHGTDGSIYIAGFSQGNLDGQANSGASDAFITKYNQSGTKSWTRLIGTSADDRAYEIKTGVDGSIYLAGTSGGNLDGQINLGFIDVFVVKYTAEGNKAWTRLLGSERNDYAAALTTSLDDSIYVAGYTDGNLDGQVNSGSSDAFIAKYGSDGTKIWTRLLGTSGEEYAEALTTGLDGSIYVSGNTSKNLDGQLNSGDIDAFVTKFNSGGTKIWTRLLGTSGYENATALTTGLDGSIYVSGSTTGSLDGQINSGKADAFITKFNPDGSKAWTRLLGGTNYERANSLIAGNDGAIYVAGYTDGNLDGQTFSGSWDSFVSKYNSDGSKAWTRLIGASSAEAITVDKFGSIFISGYTAGYPIIVGTYLAGYASIDAWEVGYFDAYVMKLTSPDTSSPQMAVSTNKTSLNVGESAELIFTLTKSSANFVLSDVSVLGGTLSDFQGSGTAYTAIFTAGIEGANGASVSVGNGKFSDALGIFNEDGADANNKALFTVKVPVDNTPPTISVTSSALNISVSQTATITFILSEISTTFTVTDVSVNGGTLSNFSGSGTTYTALFTATPNSTNNGVLSVASGVFTDAAGNSNADGSDSNNSLYFTSIPLVTNKTHTLSVIVDKNVLGTSATLLKELKESITYTNGAITKHSVEYTGVTFDYNQIDSLITTVTRDGEFTAEFTKEINDYLGTELNITYSAAVKLVGAASIDGVILSVAGADENFVG
jgi:hypothetical protein